MRYVLFGGGLGDVYGQIHLSDRYVSLSSMEPGERAVVFLDCHNPHAAELFEWHPRRDALEIRDVRGVSKRRGSQRRALGLDLVPPGERPRGREPVVYYPPPADRALLQGLPWPYIVFGLSASDHERSVPVSIAEEAAEIAVGMGLAVVLSGRNYERRFYKGRRPHRETTIRGPGIVDTIDRLTVPGVGQLMQGAAAVFCAHSAHTMLGWALRLPTYCLVDEAGWERHFKPLGPYAFGALYAESCARPISKWEPDHFRHFLTSLVSPSLSV